MFIHVEFNISGLFEVSYFELLEVDCIGTFLYQLPLILSHVA